jgi:hypothetical protein
MIRKLKIAFSVVCGIVCLLLIVLWIRSYWWCDIAEGALTRSSGFRIASRKGDVSCRKYPASKAGWGIRSIEMEMLRVRTGWSPPPGFYWRWQISPIVQAPHHFLLCTVAVLAAAPWVRWRFSLRTLLIATTLVALLLGAIVYAIR